MRSLVAYTDSTGFGGAELSLHHLLAALDARTHVVVVGTDANVLGRVVATRPDTSTELLPVTPGRRDPRGLAVHLQLLRRLSPDVLHVNLSWPGACHYAILAGLCLPGVAVVAVEQLPLPMGPGPGRNLKRLVSARLDAHVAVGERAARDLERWVGLRTGSVRTIYNGVPVPAAAVAHQLPGGPAPGPVIGVLARFDALKGLDVLLRALVELPGVTAVLVGGGPERRSLERLAVELGIQDRVRLVDWVERAADLLPLFDVVALPSRAEGFPLSLVEAMLAGRPVVATRVGSIPEAVEDGVSGLLVPPDDPSALAAALHRLLSASDAAAAMGEAARDRARGQFTDTAMACAFEVLYADVLRRRASSVTAARTWLPR